jgi:hypothetical protein
MIGVMRQAQLLVATFLVLGCARPRVETPASTASPDPAARFIGAWRIDSTKMASVGGGTGSGRGGGGGQGGGIGMGPSPDMLVVRRGSNTLTFDQLASTTNSRLTFLLDGKKIANTIGSGTSARQGVYLSAWKDSRLVTTITAPAAKGSTAMVTYEDVRYIDETGALVVEISIPGRQNSRRVVYRKIS